MVVQVRDNAKLQNTRIGDLALDLLNLRRIHIRNDDLKLVVPSRSHHRLVHPRRIDPIEDRCDEVLGRDPITTVTHRRLIDLINQIRSTLDVRTELQLPGRQHNPRGNHCQENPTECHRVTGHLQPTRKELTQDKGNDHGEQKQADVVKPLPVICRNLCNLCGLGRRLSQYRLSQYNGPSRSQRLHRIEQIQRRNQRLNKRFQHRVYPNPS